MKDPKAVKEYLLTLQTQLLSCFQHYESKPFVIDEWQRAQGGGGKSCVLRQGKVFESVGVNFSHIFGRDLPPTARAHRPGLRGGQFEAMGVSCVVHPQNPYLPTTHMNVRFFIAWQENATPVWWFGGGFDLTPYYPFFEDVVYWHQTAQQACASFGESVYPHYKKWADQYFYLPHRQEARGVGGLFFDDLDKTAWGWDFAKCFTFLRSVGDHFWQAYGPLVEKRATIPFTQHQRDFQLYRRGRYVEFNLVYDRGTLFGLQSGGRTESILMSLPPLAAWEYQWQAVADSPEARLGQEYLVARDWINS